MLIGTKPPKGLFSPTGALLSLALLLSQVLPSAAGLENTVSVRGSSPGKQNDVMASTSLIIPVETAAPELTVTIEPDRQRDVAVGETVTFTYRVENTGTVTLKGIRLGVVQEGAGAAPAAVLAEAPLADAEPMGDSTDGTLDESWDVLAPGDAVTFTARYTIDRADLDGNGGGDGVLDHLATASASFGSIATTAETKAEIDLEDIVATLEVTKTADRTAGVAAGDVITYTFTVTNTGNVAITSISLTESHNGSGPAPVPGDERLTGDAGRTDDSTDGAQDGVWDVLGPGDTVTFTARYTVTQADIDTLQ
jgi:hypothetical protein